MEYVIEKWSIYNGNGNGNGNGVYNDCFDNRKWSI